MKMLFSSSDGLEIEATRQKFEAAGIACEIRRPSATAPVANGAIPFYPELWVRNDGSYNEALKLYCQIGVGFARRSGIKRQA
jgi:hypothetical protein